MDIYIYVYMDIYIYIYVYIYIHSTYNVSLSLSIYRISDDLCQLNIMKLIVPEETQSAHAMARHGLLVAILGNRTSQIRVRTTNNPHLQYLLCPTKSSLYK